MGSSISLLSRLATLVLVLSFSTLATAAPTIASLSPTSGAVGATVTITGTNFGTTGTIKFNTTTATATSWGATSIVTTVPAGATNGNVVVTVGGVASNGKAFTVVAAPSITSLSPTSGIVGTSVTITGTNFGTTTGTVKFNNTASTPTSWTATAIHAPVPAGATNGNVVVHASGVDSNGKAFTVLIAPSITSLSITTGAVGATVTITGTNFGTTGTIKFNTTTATATSWSATSIVTTVPAGATNGNVVVTVGGVASNGKAFTVVAAPSITSLSPTSGVVGTSVTITGTNFGSTTGTVNFNGAPTTPTSWTATTINAPVPAGAALTGNVVVHASGVDSNGKAFTVLVPNITGISPASGAAGASVTISGTNFGTSAGTVSFGGTVASNCTWLSATAIACVVPTGALVGADAVVVTSSVGSVSNGFTFSVVSAPSITSLTPTSGQIGASVTIAGNNFGSTQDIVQFNGTSATISSWTPTSITTTVPSGANSGGVTVHASGVFSAPSNFTVILPPAITALYPSSGPPGGTVTISGSNFSPDSAVTFNGLPATVSTVSSTAITVGVPPGATPGNVIVTSNGLVSNSSSFTVTGLPTITSISPTTGSAGTIVTVTGTNFGSTESGAVFLNGTLMTVKTWNATTITVRIESYSTSGSLIVSVAGVNSNPATLTVPGAVTSISEVSPASAPVGAFVTISGRNFGGSGTVQFNGIAATPTAWTDTSIVVTVPVGTTNGSVVVTALTQSSPFAFTVLSSPNISSISPASGPVGTVLTIQGTNFGATQGNGWVVINGTAATIGTWSDTQITATVQAATKSGAASVYAIPNTAVQSNAMTVTVSGPSGSPSSLTISPSAVSIVSGDSRQLSLVGDGQTLSGATWTTSNASIISVSTTSPGYITGLSAGSATVTATLGAQTATATVTVYTGVLPAGTVVWSASPSPGSVTNVQMIPAESSSLTDPDVYTYETYSYGYAGVRRALNSQGALLWSVQEDGSATGTITDVHAGLIVSAAVGGIYSISRRDPATGQESWRYTAPSGSTAYAQASDSAGTVYAMESGQSLDLHVVALDGVTGQPTFRIPIPLDHNAGSSVCPLQSIDIVGDYYSQPRTGPMTIGPDDTVYLPIFRQLLLHNSDCYYLSESLQYSIALLRILPSGSSSWTTIASYPTVFSGSGYLGCFPGEPASVEVDQVGLGQVIPTDLTSDVLVNWSYGLAAGYCGGAGHGAQSEIAYVSNGSPTNTYALLGAYPSTSYAPAVLPLVLGENNLAYTAFDPSPTTNPAPKALAFNITTGNPAWTTNTSEVDLPSVATPNGFVTASVNGALATYDQSGTPTSYNLGLPYPIFRDGGTWNGVSASFSPMGVQAGVVDAALSPSPRSPSLGRGSANAGRVSARLTQRAAGSTVSTDDERFNTYNTTFGTTNLGPIIENGSEVGCSLGSEMVGKITPHDYLKSITLHRRGVARITYKNTTVFGTHFEWDDTSDPSWRDDVPQSGGSLGKVYDLDNPGFVFPLNTTGDVYRYRVNFYAYATLPNGARISPYFGYNLRLSCTQSSSGGLQFVNDVPGDNQIGVGPGFTTWNLLP